MSFEDPVWLRITPILVLLFGGILAYGFRHAMPYLVVLRLVDYSTS